MKAVIMAGGEGKRLRPLSANKPKPMVELFDKPVLEHIIRLLIKNGVTEACLTLKYLPKLVTDYFSSGDFNGIRLDYRIETAALGTAGGVLNCTDFIGEDDFLVISGDCVCDFDLKALMEFHREKKADVTLALYSHVDPCEYGLVVTAADGRIERFVEKPAWDNVLTDQINTGIYVVSARVLDDIPKGEASDFGRDIFPKLLKEGRRLFGYDASGYWCDVGSLEAYTTCCHDILRGEVNFDMNAPNVKSGVWCAGELPVGVTLIPPVYIGKNAVIDKGAEIGPLSVIGASSVIASGAVIRRSVVNGAVFNEDTAADGAVVGKGTSIGRGTLLGEGAVVGDGCIIGDGCVISSSARIWPDRQIQSGSVISGNVAEGMHKDGLSFKVQGVLSGDFGISLTAEACLRLGEAAGQFRRVGVGWSGGEAARVLAEAFGSGVCATGGELLRYDGSFRAQASYAGTLFDLPLTVFVEEIKDCVSIVIYGPGGRPLAREIERKLAAALSEPHETLPRGTGRATCVTGVWDAYISSAVRRANTALESTGSLTVAVTGSGAENRALKNALQLMACKVSDKTAGVPVFEVADGGYYMTATDEEGYRLSDDRLRVIAAYIACAWGTKTLVVTHDVPGVVEQIAEEFGTELLRLGRDGPRAETLYMDQQILRDSVFTGVLICSWLKSTGEKLSALRERLPRYAVSTREVTIKSSRGTAMRKLSSDYLETAADPACGLRFDTERGHVLISPLRDKSALKIRAESFNEETAEELCAEFERRAQENDQ